MGEERRIVSVLFVDMVGSTARAEKLDPEDIRVYLDAYFASVRAEIERFGGRVEKFIGDAVMGVFGAPTAHGDDAERAVRAALAVRDWAEQDGLEVRIAVNTGEAIVVLEAQPGRGEAMVAGDVVNTAARLQTSAPVGAVLVGEETYTITRNTIEYRPAQPVLAKGKSAPVRAWLALRPTSGIGERPVAPVPMIGRERELETLADIWERVSNDGRAHFVTAFGPAGIGKSRLGLELSQLVAGKGGRAVRGRSTPYGQSTPYGAFAQQVKQVAGIFDNDDPVEARDRLVSGIAQVTGPAAAEEHAPHLAMLLGLDTEGEETDRETLLFSARVFVESLALDTPTMLLYEDIHWADESLLDLLHTLAARIRDVPVMLVALARPELLAERPGWGGGLPAYTALQVEPLTGTDDHGLDVLDVGTEALHEGSHRRDEDARGALRRTQPPHRAQASAHGLDGGRHPLEGQRLPGGEGVDGLLAEVGPEVVGEAVGVAGGGHRHHDRTPGRERGQPSDGQGARRLRDGKDRRGPAEHGREAGLLAQQRGEVAEQHEGSAQGTGAPLSPGSEC